MTTEQILKGVYAILQTLPAEERLYAEKQIAANKKTSNDNGFTCLAIANLVISLKDDLAKQEAKKGGKSAALKAVNSMLKEASLSPRCKTLWNAPIIDGRQCICDGYRLVRLVEHLPLNVPVEPLGYIDTDRFIPPAMFRDGNEIDLPESAKLRAYIKDFKAKRTSATAPKFPIYRFGENLPAVDARLLADMMAILPDCKAYADGVKSNVFFRCEDGSDGLLCAVHTDDHTKTEL